jgi:hypothetical protein
MRTPKLPVYLVIFCLAVVSVNGRVAGRSSDSKIIFNPPEWILGQWTNLAESQTDRIEMFDFSAHEIRLTTGVLDKTVKFSNLFKKQEIKETFEPDIYRIQIGKGEEEMIYEFRLCRSDRCESSLKEAMTYSLTKNKKIVRDHSTAINSVFIKRQRI